jgi:hypothetical protein
MDGKQNKNSLSWAFSQKIFRTQNNPLPPLKGIIKEFM